MRLPDLLRGCRQHRRRLTTRRSLAALLAVAAIATLSALGLRGSWHGQQQQEQLERPSYPVEKHADWGNGPAAAAAADDAAPWAVRKRVEAKLLIPRRIHHYFSASAGIPARLVQEITSWASNHRDYDIYYWDAGHVEQHLLTRPEYAKYHRYYWNGTQSRHERDLIAKLLILHQLGGILPDLNVRSLRESTDYLTESSCVVAQDRVERAVFAYGLESLPSAAVLACRPRHHFLTYFLRKVTEVEFRTGAVVLDVETATFLAHVFNAAVAAFDEECASRGVCDFPDRVSLAEPHVFMPAMPPELFDSLVDNCRAREKLPFLQKEACYNLDVNGNAPTSASLAMPIYAASGAPNKDRPLMPLDKIGPSNGGRRPIKNWSKRGGDGRPETRLAGSLMTLS